MENNTLKLYPIIIKACAGSGKTHQLTNQYLKLLFWKVKPENILATTFTRKAAGEIKERIIFRLAKSTTSKEETLKLSEELEININLNQCQNILKDLIHNLHKVNIITLDSLIVRIVKVFHEYFNLNHNWIIRENSTTNSTINNLLDSVLYANNLEYNNYQNFIKILSPSFKNKSILNITQLLNNHLYEIIDTNYNAMNAQWGIEDFLKKEYLIQPEIPEMEVIKLPKNKKGDFNTFWQKALTKVYENFYNQNHIEIVSETFINRAINNENYYKIEFSEEIISLCQSIFNYSANQLLLSLDTKTKDLKGLFDKVFLAYKDYLIHQEELGFNDIKFALKERINNSYENSLNLNDIFYRLDTKFKHILFDEFQDTSHTEWSILYQIIDEVMQATLNEQNRLFFCVGDSKQAIYGWRGADNSIFDQIPHLWKNEEELNNSQIKVLTIPESRRCGKEVIDIVNTIFLNLKKNIQENSKLYLKDAIDCFEFEKHNSNNNNKGEVLFKIFNSITGKKNQKTTEDANEIEDIDYSEKELLFLEVAKDIIQISEKIEQNTSNTIGILCRTKEECLLIGKSLKKINPSFSFSYEGGKPLIEMSLIKWLIAHIFCFSNIEDSYHLNYLLYSKASQEIELTDKESILYFYQKLKKDNCLNRELLVLELIKRLPFAILERETNHNALIEFNLLLKKHKKANNTDFKNICSNYSTNFCLFSNTRIMTIHASKGLEFDFVFLPFLKNKIFSINKKLVLTEKDNLNKDLIRIIKKPSPAELQSSMQLLNIEEKRIYREIKESLSLLYVALTRAKKSLYLYANEKDIKIDKLSFASLIANAIGMELFTEKENYRLFYLGEKTNNYNSQKIESCTLKYNIEEEVINRSNIQYKRKVNLIKRKSIITEIKFIEKEIFYFTQSINITLNNYYQLLQERINTTETKKYLEQHQISYTPYFSNLQKPASVIITGNFYYKFNQNKLHLYLFYLKNIENNFFIGEKITSRIQDEILNIKRKIYYQALYNLNFDDHIIKNTIFETYSL